MKRTYLLLDRKLLEETVRTLDAKTYSAAINTALAEFFRMRRIQNLPQFFGIGLWEGKLTEMREDRPNERRRTIRERKR